MWSATDQNKKSQIKNWTQMIMMKNMKIKFNLDDDLPLNKMLELWNMKRVSRSVFLESNKYYSQVFQDRSLCKLWII